MKIKSGFTTLVTSAFLSTSTLTWSDDTDIFLSNAAAGSQVQPNVLFVLDNSGSMGYSLSDGSGKRIESLETSLKQVIDNTEGINIGLLRYWDNNSLNDDNNGLYHPIMDIDALLSDEILSLPTINAGTDDVTQTHTGTMDLDSDTLVIGEKNIFQIGPINRGNQSNLSANQRDDGSAVINNSKLKFGRESNKSYTTGLIFDGLGIPENANILDARITLTPWFSIDLLNTPLHLQIRADQRANPPLFGSSSNTPRERNKTSNEVDWVTDAHPVANNSKTMTPNLSSIVQEVVDTVNFNTDRIAFIFDDINNNDVDDAHDTTSSKMPTFSLTYSLDTPEAEKVLGLRFEEVNVPQGAVVTSAKIRLFSKGGNNSNLKMTIQAEDNINPSTFASTASNISTRTLTSPPVTWDSPVWPDYSPSADSPPEAIYTTDIKNVVQSVVDKTNWCGGNPMAFVIKAATGESGFRAAFSSEDNSLYRPSLELNYNYDPSMTGTGCMKRRFSTSIQEDIDDAQKNGNSTKTKRDSLALSSEEIGLRFNNLPIKQGSTILEAYLEFNAYYSSYNSETISIFGENIDTSPAFTTISDSITGRTKTSSNTSWSINTNWQPGQAIRSPDIKNVVQEIVNRSRWHVGNNMAFILDSSGSPANSRRVYSFDGNQGLAPRLIIKVGNDDYDDSTQLRVRDRVKSYVEHMGHRPNGGTPTVDRLRTAAQYFQGSNSPIQQSCQTNHVVLLSDGVPTGLSTDTKSFINNVSGGSPCTGTSEDKACGKALSKWMLETDFSTVTGNNRLILHTIGFDLGSCSDGAIKDTDGDACVFLKSLANPNDETDLSQVDGTFSTANNTEQLVTDIKKLLEGAKASESSFTSPGVAANQYNNSTHLSQLYYSIFKPSAKDRWNGNIKRYTLSTDPAGIFDVNDIDAVDPATGFFTSNSTSFWNTGNTPDGNLVSKGGVAGVLPEAGSRELFTFIGTNPAGQKVGLNDNNYKITKDNPLLTPVKMGLDATNDARKEQLISWIRDPGTRLGDPLHSVPALATYSCKAQFNSSSPFSCEEDDQRLVIFAGTNNGFLHAIDATTGVEEFSFMPQELLPNIDKLNKNKETNRNAGELRPYGLDGLITLWTHDKNRNGVIFGGADTLDQTNNNEKNDEIPSTNANEGEFVYVYAGMRRGGRNYYALDATDLDNPKLLWFIKGGEGDFIRLGQTWSKPVKTKVKIGVDSNSNDSIDDSIKDVLIFSGGYDESEDSASTYQQANMGNAIYMVDAKTGSIIWSASSPSIDENLHEFNPQDLATWGVASWNPQRTYVPVSGSSDESCAPNANRGNAPQCALKGGLVYKANHELTGGGTNPEPGTSLSAWSLVGHNGNQPIDTREHNLTLNKMNYSIPGGVRVIDLEGDGLADQMFFADTGGQVWRMFINNCKSSTASECSASSLTDVDDLVWPSDGDGDGKWDSDEGVIASLGYRDYWNSAQIQTNARKFFVEPDISAFRLNGKRYIAVAIGSGTRPDPLGQVNSTVVDRFYMMAMPTLNNPVVTHSNSNSKTVPAHTLIHHDNTTLKDVTNDLTIDDVFGTQSANWEKGWFFSLNQGEKVMTESVTFNETIFFNTYQPVSNYSNTCGVVGTGRAYSVALKNANPVKELEDDVPTFITEDGKRYGELANSGIPSKTTIIVPNGNNGIICVGAECIKGSTIGGTGKPSYWRQIK